MICLAVSHRTNLTKNMKFGYETSPGYIKSIRLHASGGLCGDNRRLGHRKRHRPEAALELTANTTPGQGHPPVQRHPDRPCLPSLR